MADRLPPQASLMKSEYRITGPEATGSVEAILRNSRNDSIGVCRGRGYLPDPNFLLTLLAKLDCALGLSPYEYPLSLSALTSLSLRT